MKDFLKRISNRDQINLLLNSMNNPIICEVGVRLGDNLYKMITPNIKEVYGIDIWMETGDRGQNDGECTQDELNNQYEYVLKRFQNDERVKFIREFSNIAAKSFPDEYFDFIYIDADHTYESVKNDLESWYPKVKRGGIISGHDYIDGDLTIRLGHSVRFGVVDAVEEFRNNNNIGPDRFHLTDEQYASYFIIKP